MITPVFRIRQEPDFIILTIRAPHANLAELEYDHGRQMFIFSCQPYFLRLYFKQMVDEYANGKGEAKYDSDSGEFTIKIAKLHQNEEFTHLDMITELLRPSNEVHGRGMVEEIDGEEEEEDVEGNEYLFDQKVAEETQESSDLSKYGYGFGWSKIGVIERLREEIGKVTDLMEPENVEIGERNEDLEKFDKERFDVERYLADTLEPEEEVLRLLSLDFPIESLQITDEDREKLKDLNVKNKLKTDAKLGADIMLSLIDIIYAYCYDQRVNDFEKTSESGWSCAKLSPSLSYLVRWNGVKEAVVGGMRRVLAYALYRNFVLTKKVFEDLKMVFGGGRSSLLHILCEIHRIFIASGEFRYILNDLFITDYIIWIQNVPDNIISDINNQLTDIDDISKNDIDWDLEYFECEAKMGGAELDSDDDDN